MSTISFDQPHRRFNPLLGQWILVSPHRTQRPWQGEQERMPPADRPAHDPHCYLCPGNRRAGEAQNPNYEHTFVFTNDYAALLPDVLPGASASHPLLRAESERGTCRVVCFSPRHDLTLAGMSAAGIVEVINTWAEQVTELGRTWRWVQVFENRGEIMGCSNPHPHGQIWAGAALPNEPAREDRRQLDYLRRRAVPLLVDYADLEIRQGDRVVAQSIHWLAVVPFWAVWPFELLVIPRRHVLRLPDLTPAERADLAQIMKGYLGKYDRLFNVSFPYSMGWHGAPTAEGDFTHWQLHAHYYPPLLRSATVKKFMVGYELLAEAQRDVTAEQAAARLRELA